MRAATLACLLLLVFIGCAFPRQSPDFNNDGAVNDADLLLFMAQWRAYYASQAWDSRYDLTGDQVLDYRDVRELLNRYFLAEGDRSLTGTVNTQDFRVGPGERVACIGDVIVQCQTASIEGELFSLPVTAAGTNGSSITIQAQGNIVVPGRILAGSGVAGAAEGNGGNGGSVTLTSANGDITLGAAAAPAAVRLAQAGGSPAIHAGDAGNGGDGLPGGAGGTGGSLVLSAPNGTLTIHQSAGLLHAGNGGHGGQAVVGGEDLLDFALPEQMPSHGGNGGQVVLVEYQTVQGLTLHLDDTAPAGQTIYVGFLDAGVGDGGHGGDGGDLYYGVDPDTEQSTWPAAAAESANATAAPAQADPTVQGAKGGDGFPAAGDGGDAQLRGRAAPLDPSQSDVSARGGDGGVVSSSQLSVLGFARVCWFGDSGVRAGNGGTAKAFGGDGGAGGACQQGSRGGHATARGGHGGAVFVALHWADPYPSGTGGYAAAIGGAGGAAGPCCGQTPGAGRNGGEGGDAQATGGNGGLGDTGGRGGAALAVGGAGGKGGAGAPPGSGGEGGPASASGGFGQPAGASNATPGAAGANGDPCPPPPANYGTFISYTTRAQLLGMLNFYYSGSAQTRAMSAGDSFTLGGEANALLAPLGRSVIIKSDNSALWAANEHGGICMYSDPLSGGDRAPDRVLNLASDPPWNSIWYDETRDILYATSHITGLIHIWDGASSGDPGRAPDRTIEIAGYLGGGYLTGAPGADRLFVSLRTGGVSRILVYDDAHTLSGAPAPNRIIEPVGGLQRNAVAWDPVRDILYYGRSGDPPSVGVITSASTRDGAVNPDRTFAVSFDGMAADDWISALVHFTGHDLLFVGTYGGSAEAGHVLVYPEASTVEGTPEAAARQSPGHAVLGLGVFKQ